MKKKAVFLDRDGTINKHVPYLKSQADFELLPRAAESIRLLNKNGFKVVVITNQSGINRGYFTVQDFQSINEKMKVILKQNGSIIDGVYYCPHVPEEKCACRKPKNGLIIQACDEMDLDSTASFMIGDRETDVRAGSISKCRTVLVLSGYGELESKEIASWPSKPDYVARDLFQATTWILNNI